MRSAAHNGALNNSTKPTAMNVCFIGSTSPTTRLPCAIVLFERRAGGGNHQHVFLRDQKLSGRRRPSFHRLGRFGAQPLPLASILVNPNVNVLIERADDRLPGE